MTVKEDKREIAIITFIKDNPGCSLRKIIKGLEKIGAKDTIDKKTHELVKGDFLKVVKAERKGQSDNYYATDLGLRTIEISPMGAITKRGLITIGFSQDFLKHLGSEAAAKRFVSMLNNPEEGPKIADLIGSQIAFYVENMITEPRFAAENIETLKRIFFVGSLPETISTTMIKAVKGGVFKNENAAFGYIITTGISTLNSALVGGLRPDPSKATMTLISSRFDPEKGVYGSGRDIVRKKLEAMAPEDVKNLILKVFSYSS